MSSKQTLVRLGPAAQPPRQPTNDNALGSPDSRPGGTAATQSDHEEWNSTPEMILHLHIAEYQALTTRITYWINLQYTVALSAATLLVLLAATSSQLPREVLLWGAAGIVDAFLAGYYYTIFEMMNNAQYIECVLAPEIRKRLPRVVFWQYERYRTGNKFYSPTGLFIPMLWSIAAPAVVIALRWRPLSLADLIGGVVTISLVCWSYALARTGCHAQRSLWKCATEEAGRTEHGERDPNTATT